MVLKLLYSRKLTLGKRLFPSPYGDMVLKSLRWDTLLCLARYAVLRRGCVLSPFRGDAVF